MNEKTSHPRESTAITFGPRERAVGTCDAKATAEPGSLPRTADGPVGANGISLPQVILTKPLAFGFSAHERIISK
jgi:hypothetical protein